MSAFSFRHFGVTHWMTCNGDSTVHASHNTSSTTDHANGNNSISFSHGHSDDDYAIALAGRSDDNGNARMAASCLASHQALPATSSYNVAFHYTNTDRRETDHFTAFTTGNITS